LTNDGFNTVVKAGERITLKGVVVATEGATNLRRELSGKARAHISAAHDATHGTIIDELRLADHGSVSLLQCRVYCFARVCSLAEALSAILACFFPSKLREGSRPGVKQAARGLWADGRPLFHYRIGEE
jgi:hypothetical protein